MFRRGSQEKKLIHVKIQQGIPLKNGKLQEQSVSFFFMGLWAILWWIVLPKTIPRLVRTHHTTARGFLTAIMYFYSITMMYFCGSNQDRNFLALWEGNNIVKVPQSHI